MISLAAASIVDEHVKERANSAADVLHILEPRSFHIYRGVTQVFAYSSSLEMRLCNQIQVRI